MNLKNCKFYKRIQEINRLSKKKKVQLKQKPVGEQPHQLRISQELQNAFNERNGAPQQQNRRHHKHIAVLPQIAECDEEEVEYEEANSNEVSPMAEQECEQSGRNKITSGLIHFNDTCFTLKSSAIKADKASFEPTIKGTKASICVSNSRYAMIGRISRLLGFNVVKESKMWNILWTDSLPGVEIYKIMKRFQQINHYPGMLEICRKDLLSRNLNRMLKLFPSDYKIFPKTWIFPADYGEAMTYSQNHFKNRPRTFIIKPDSGAQGRGIWLTNDLKTVSPTDRLICQTYISRPLLIDGYKFDLRVYALITSVDPLRIFVYNEGLARFATSKYTEPCAANASDLFMHLTNYSVNRRNSQYDVSDNDECGSKRKFSAVNNWMRQRNYDVDEFWRKIDDIIIKTVLSAWPMLRHNYHACFSSHDKIQACFEILGFDILVDSKLKPYILEVNHSPSFHCNEQVDKEVKRALIRDTLTMVGTALADKRQILREDRKRVKQRLLQRSGGSSNRSHLLMQQQAQDGNADVPLLSSNNGHCPLSPLAQQIAWEESHMGEFRRVMPPHDQSKINYYSKFFALQNQSSIYGETAASKKREEQAKRLRCELEEKRLKQKALIESFGRMRFEERRQKRASLPRTIVEKKRLRLIKRQANWLPGFISDAEERLRYSWTKMRNDLLRDTNIVQHIYQNFYLAGTLSNADKANYPELFRSLENGNRLALEE